MPLSSRCLKAATSIFQGRVRDMMSFPGFGRPHNEISQMLRWVLMFLAGKPVQGVHDLSSLPWADQLGFLWWLLHAVPSGTGAVCAVPCSLHDAELGCAVRAVPAALAAPDNVVVLLFVPSQMTLPAAA